MIGEPGVVPSYVTQWGGCKPTSLTVLPVIFIKNSVMGK